MNENDIWLIAGLGNPEAKYDGTRHNAGFAALDALADKWNISVGKTKFQGLWGQGEVDGHKVVLLKPLTYMNLSGDSIAPMAGFFKIPADHVLVLCDDITKAPGKLRIRPSGSAGGHNGLKSIIARLGGENFPRIRIGIGAKPHPDYDLAAWVLGKFPPEDAKAISDRYADLEAAAKLIMDGKLGLAQSKYNGYKSFSRILTGKEVFPCTKPYSRPPRNIRRSPQALARQGRRRCSVCRPQAGRCCMPHCKKTLAGCSAS